VIIERKRENHTAAYAYGAFGPLNRTALNDPSGLCPRYLLSDGRGNTVASCDNAGHMVVQHFDAFGLPLSGNTIGVAHDDSKT